MNLEPAEIDSESLGMQLEPAETHFESLGLNSERPEIDLEPSKIDLTAARRLSQGDMNCTAIWYLALGQVKRLDPAGSAVLFGAIHLNLAAIVPIVVMALGLAFLYDRSGSVVPGIVAHGFNNAVAITLLYAGVAG